MKNNRQRISPKLARKLHNVLEELSTEMSVDIRIEALDVQELINYLNDTEEAPKSFLPSLEERWEQLNMVATLLENGEDDDDDLLNRLRRENGI